MSDVQWVHYNLAILQGYPFHGTIAIKTPTQDELDLMFNNLKEGKSEVMLQIGIAKLGRKDNFSKKIGRELSKTRLTNTLGKLTQITLQEYEVKYYLSFDKFNLVIIENSKYNYIRVLGY